MTVLPFWADPSWSPAFRDAVWALASAACDGVNPSSFSPLSSEALSCLVDVTVRDVAAARAPRLGPPAPPGAPDGSDLDLLALLAARPDTPVDALLAALDPSSPVAVPIVDTVLLHWLLTHPACSDEVRLRVAWRLEGSDVFELFDELVASSPVAAAGNLLAASVLTFDRFSELASLLGSAPPVVLEVFRTLLADELLVSDVVPSSTVERCVDAALRLGL